MGKFCLDTNIFISAWNVYYPIDVFPNLWSQLVENKEKLEVIKPIQEELQKGDDDLWKWFEAQSFTVYDLNNDVEKQSLNLEGKYETRINSKGAGSIDIKLIAYAKYHKKTVVTLEKRQIEKPDKFHNYKIPLICQEESVECIDLVTLLRRLGIKL